MHDGRFLPVSVVVVVVAEGTAAKNSLVLRCIGALMRG